MSINKDQLLRHRILDRCFSCYEYTFAELKNTIEKELNDSISEKTLRNDIKYFREEYGAPLKDGQRYYKYSDPSFSIPEFNPMSITDAEQIIKDQLLRHQFLDRCLGEPNGEYTFEKLLLKLNRELTSRNLNGVSEQTLRNDIKYFREHYKAPLEEGQRYYQYTDTSFSIPTLNLMSMTEAEQLIDFLSILIEGIPQMDWLEKYIEKVKSGYNIDRSYEGIVYFEKTTDYMGNQWFSQLFNAIRNKQALEITYYSFSEKETKIFTFSPYFLKQYSKRWYIFGYDDKKILKNYPLDRIQNIENSKSEYFELKINIENFFSDIVGVTHLKNVKKEHIEIQVREDYIDYFDSKPFFDNLKPVDTKNHIYSMDISPNFELLTYLMSQANNIKVLSSETVENKIKKRLADACKLWDVDPSSYPDDETEA